jgi:predicted nucleic acid-binding protein
MKYLLDVNVLVAWGWSDHVAHEQTVEWLAATTKQKAARLLTSPIPELGFVRVSVQRTAGRVTVSTAGEALAGMLRSLGTHHAFLPDDQPASRFPDWCGQASRTTDAHLIELATAHRGNARHTRQTYSWSVRRSRIARVTRQESGIKPEQHAHNRQRARQQTIENHQPGMFPPPQASALGLVRQRIAASPPVCIGGRPARRPPLGPPTLTGRLPLKALAS